MIQRTLRWMFGKKQTNGGDDPSRIYRILFWLLVIAGGMVALAVWFKWILYFALTFVTGALTGILLERRRRRRILREADIEASKGLFGWRRKKKRKTPPEDTPEQDTSSQTGKEN